MTLSKNYQSSSPSFIFPTLKMYKEPLSIKLVGKLQEEHGPVEAGLSLNPKHENEFTWWKHIKVERGDIS